MSTRIFWPEASSIVCPTVGRTPTNFSSTHGVRRRNRAGVTCQLKETSNGLSSRQNLTSVASTALCSSPKEDFFAPSRKTL